MELRQLRYFLGVCRSGSIAQAAKELHIAQPALSRQITSLEQDLGEALFVRHARGVGLTRAGEELRARAEEILADSAALSSRIKVASGGLTGTLKIGVMPGYTWLPELSQAIAALGLEAPDVVFQIEPMFSSEQLARMARGELDVGIAGWRSPFNADFIGRKVFSDRMILAAPSGSHLAIKEDALWLKDVARENLLMFARDRSPAHYDALAQSFSTAGVKLKRAKVSVFDIAAAMGMVAAGLGCAIVPESFKYQWAERAVFRSVEDLDVQFNLEVIRHVGASDPLVDRFLTSWPQATPIA